MPSLEINLVRYRGHLSMPEVGLAGQRKLARSSVLCIGTGGLGSPASLYLAAAGVGRIGLLDSDVVDESNLHRQILFRTSDIGASKVEVARQTLAALNPDVELVVHRDRLTADNAADLLAGYDVIIDGTDNFPTRYLINDTCVQLGKADVWASIYRFEGQLSVFDARQGPCYRCLFPEIPPAELIPSCAEAGVLGVLPGILGTSQALEAIKAIVGIGRPLIGRLLVFDALAFSWRELAFAKDPACPACGTATAVKKSIPPVARRSQPAAVEPLALQKRLAAADSPLLLDCREPFEWDICHLAGSQLIPMRELPGRLAEIAHDRSVVVICHHGPRSLYAAAHLLETGFSDVSYLDGGLHRWAMQVDTTMAQY